MDRADHYVVCPSCGRKMYPCDCNKGYDHFSTRRGDVYCTECEEELDYDDPEGDDW